MAANTTTIDVTDVAWDLEPLLPAPGEPGVDQLLDEVDAITADLEGYRGRVAGLDTTELASLLDRLAELNDKVGRAGNYASLRFAVDTADPAIAALMQRVQERLTQVATKLLFFDLEWAEVDDAAADALLASPELDQSRHYLRSLRRYRDHLLSEPEEVVLTEKTVTGSGAWSRLFSEQTSVITVEMGGEELSLELGLSRLQSADPEVRRTAAAAVTEALAPGLRTRGYIFNTLLADKSIDDRLRKYPSWVSSRNLSNEASDESVAALVEAVVGRYSIPQRWYEAKAKMLGVDAIDDWDRYASVADDTTEFDWDDARGIVLDSYRSFSPDMAGVVEQFFDEAWIDAPLRPAKRGGAFCAYTVPSHHPYLLLNWTSTRRDVLTLAHELGHGIHAYLSRPQGIFHQTTPLTLAETASVFGETLTFGRLVAQASDPNDRLPLLAEHLEDQIATVFRQIAMWRFEDGVHTSRREEGELSADRFGDIWNETQAEMLGKSVRLSDGYRSWWSYIPHFIHTPGYVYAYAYGQLLALSVYARYEDQGPDFVPSYLELLSAGGSMPPEELGKLVGVDLADPGFWDAGLDIIERQLTETLDTAKAAGRLT
ncbi:MAG TPA: M3 family oligoendopeptidase [Microthrixaceae bacterium]|nr:M3 family oligoendopeptidase [Microthrixaceae bacterium]